MRLSLRSLFAVSLFLTACPPTPTTETLEITPATLALQTGETRSVSAQVKSGSSSAAAAGATWTSSDGAVVSVSSTGDGTAALQGLSAGTATITAKLREATASLTVTVTNRAVTLSSIELTPAAPSLAKGTMLQLTATGRFSDTTTAAITDATWSSADESILTVDSTGLVSGLLAGSTLVTATKGTVSAMITVTVTAARLVAVEVTPAMPSLARGTTEQLVATARFSDATTQDVSAQATWTSATETSVTVDANGLVTAIDLGSSLVTATLNGVSGRTTVTVTDAVLTAIEVTPAAPSIPLGLTRQLAATGRFSDNTTQDLTSQATWTSGTTAVATVSNGGLVSTLTLGTSEVSAVFDGITGSTTVTVSAAELVSLAVTPEAQSLARGLTRNFVATGTYSDNTTQTLTDSVVWSSSAPTTANVSNATGSKGLVTALAVGNVTITATSGTISDGTTLTVTSASVISIQVTPTTPSVPKGLTQNFIATGLLTDGTMQNITTTVTWTTGTPATATISNAPGSEGLLTTIAEGTSAVTATLGSVSGSTTVTVTAARLDRIDVTPVTPQVALGRTLQFTATGVYSDGTTQPLTTQVTWVAFPGTVATISNASGSQGLLSTALTGNVTVTATLNSVSGSQPVTVTAAELKSIAVTPALQSIAKGRTQQYVAMGTFSNNTTQNLTTQVTWSTGTPATATISNVSGSQGLATSLADGTTTVVATLSGVTGQTTLTVTPAELVSIAITAAPATLPRGRSVNLIATGTYTDNTSQPITTQVSWSASPTSRATVSNVTGTNGRVTAVAVGSVIITATLSSVSQQVTIDVTAAVLESLAITPATLSIAKGRTQQYTVEGTYSDGTTQTHTNDVTWGSSSPTSLSISNASGSNGFANAVEVGSGNVTAQLSGVTATVPFTVTNAVLVSIVVTPATPTIAKGRAQQFVATGTFSDNSQQTLTTSVVWTSGTPATATISNAPASEGLATGAGEGTSVITATSGSVSGSATLTVGPPVLVSIVVTPATPSIILGGTLQFTATGTFSDSTTRSVTAEVMWTSSDSSVGISNASGSEGLATASSVGSSTVSATSGSVSGSTVVTVTTVSLVSIVVTPVTPTVIRGLTQQFTAMGNFSDSTSRDITGEVSWSSSNANVSISSTGLATADAVGTSTVTATSGSISDSTVVTVAAPTLVSIAVTPANTSLAKGRTAQFVAMGTYSNSTTSDVTASATWSTGATATATVNATGLVTAAGEGSTTVIATLDSVSGNTPLTVTPAELVSIAISGAPGSPLPLGRTADLVATGTYTDTTTQILTTLVTWASADPNIASVSNTTPNQGRVTAVAVGTVNITATLGAVMGNVSITTAPAVLVSIVVTPANPSLLIPGTQQMIATGTFSDNTTAVVTGSPTIWNSQTQTTATVSAGGNVTAVAPGTSLITATRSGVTGSTTVTTTYPVPTVTATSPADASIGVRAAAPIAFTFSHAMDPASLTAQTAAGPCTGTLQASADNFSTCIAFTTAAPVMSGSPANTVATLQPASALTTLATYRLRVDQAARSSNNVQLASTFTQLFGFTIATDGNCAATVVISQLYGAGGNSGALYNADFVELHNPGTTPVSLNGLSFQYAGATGTSWQARPLPNVTIPAGGYHLIRLQSAGSTGAAVPADSQLASNLDISGTAGKFALTTVATAFPSGTACPIASSLDFVGFGTTGTTANCFEGTAPTPAPSVTLSISRAGAGCNDANTNNNDFTSGAPTFRNASTTPRICECTANETDKSGELDYCNLQFPTSFTTDAGVPSVTIYTQVYEATVTEPAGAGVNLRAQVGYGPSGVNPATTAGWTWFPATFNVQVMNNDEFQGSFATPDGGSYGYTSRISRDGTNWTYCDLNGAGSNPTLTFEPSQLGVMTVTP